MFHQRRPVGDLQQLVVELADEILAQSNFGDRRDPEADCGEEKNLTGQQPRPQRPCAGRAVRNPA